MLYDFQVTGRASGFSQGPQSHVGWSCSFFFPRASGPGCSNGRGRTGGMPRKKLDVSTQSLLNQILAPGYNCCAAVLGLSAVTRGANLWNKIWPPVVRYNFTCSHNFPQEWRKWILGNANLTVFVKVNIRHLKGGQCHSRQLVTKPQCIKL